MLKQIGYDQPVEITVVDFETNADVARIAWREPGGKAWREAPIDRFERASAVELWAGRAVPSRHNASAPDMRFSDFNAAAR